MTKIIKLLNNRPAHYKVCNHIVINAENVTHVHGLEETQTFDVRCVACATVYYFVVVLP